MSAVRRYGALLQGPGVRSAVVLSVLCRLPMLLAAVAGLLALVVGAGGRRHLAEPVRA